MKRYLRLLLVPIILLAASTVADAQVFNSAPFNGTGFNGAASATVPFNQFVTTQLGGNLTVTGHKATDTLGYILNVTSGVTTAVIVGARFEVKNAATDTDDVFDVLIDSSGDAGGQITNAGDGSTVNFSMFFVIPASTLTAGRTYAYKISTTDTGGKVAVYQGTIRQL